MLLSRGRNDLFQVEIEPCSLSSVRRTCFLGLWILEFPDERLFVTSLLLWNYRAVAQIIAADGGSRLSFAYDQLPDHSGRCRMVVYNGAASI